MKFKSYFTIQTLFEDLRFTGEVIKKFYYNTFNIKC